MNRSERRRQKKKSRSTASTLPMRTDSVAPSEVSEQMQSLIAAGKTAHASGDLEKAIQTYSHILSIDPKQPTALYLLGIVFLQSGKNEQAIEFIRRSLSVFPNNPEANNNLGVALNATGKTEEAATSYRQAITLKPDYTAAYKNLGALLASNNKLDNGLDCYRQAVSLAPSLFEGHKAIGDILFKQHKYDEALDSYFTALALNRSDADVLTSAGNALQFLSRNLEALNFHSQAINLAPDHDRHWIAFSDCISAMSFASTDDNLESSLLRLLEKRILQPAPLMFPIISALKHRKDLAHLLDNSNEISTADPLFVSCINSLAQSQLFMRLMTMVPIADLRVERLLTATRSALLQAAINNSTSENHIDFLAALAQQCFINEYAYSTTDEELQHVDDLSHKINQLFEQDQTVSPDLWLIVGCYLPLKDLPWIEQLSLHADDKELGLVYSLQVTAPATEKQLSKTIPQLTEIADATSQSVRSQYEENPYPRWIYTANITPKPIKDVLCGAPLSLNLDNYDTPKNLDTLVAGCGTGQHALQAAARFTNTKLTAVDLSLSSLSYAKRKTQEMGIDNIEYIQGDILELDKIGKQFDVIECGGVLHHMAEPLKGWEVLVRLLRSGGLMKIGLYSERGRPDIIAAREFIAKGGYGSSTSEMRRCREDIIAAAEQGNQALIQLCRRSDFYSLSPCRDLIFHVQEHRFTIPEIAKALKSLGLDFLGFETPNPQPLVRFRKQNPSYPKSLELARWDRFEERYPDTFRGMYQFWCRKTAR